jgi:hypothetical protein
MKTKSASPHATVRQKSVIDVDTRLGVTAELCCDCVRNAAYYRAGWASPTILKKAESDFWVNLNGNFLDIAVLDWCFIFGDSRAEFRWQKLISDKTGFSARMYASLGCTEQEFNDYASTMRLYRDKRVAHRDRYLVGDPKIIYPPLDLAVKSTSFLFTELVRLYHQMEEINAHKDLGSFYEDRLEHGRREYEGPHRAT